MWVTPFRPLRDGEILDAGYHELMCTRATAERLIGGGMTHVNGRAVSLRVYDECSGVDAVIVKVQPVEGVWETPAGTYDWQKERAVA